MPEFRPVHSYSTQHLAQALAQDRLVLRLGAFSTRISARWPAIIAPLINHLQITYAHASAALDDDMLTHQQVHLSPPNLLRGFIRPQVRGSTDIAMPAVPLPVSMSALAFEMAWNLKVALGHFNHVIFHAAAVSFGDQAILLPAGSGSGKSTLCCLLMQHGARLLSDEFGLLNPNTGLLAGFPRAVSLKNQSIAAVRAYVPDRALSAPLTSTPKGIIAYRKPRKIDLATQNNIRPAWVIMPKFRAGQRAEIRELSPATAFTRLIQSSTNYQVMGEAGFNALRSMLRHAPAYDITYGSSEAALEIVDKLRRGVYGA